MKKLGRIALKEKSIMSASEMKKIKAGWICTRSGSNEPFVTDSWEVAYSWMLVWSAADQNVRCKA